MKFSQIIPRVFAFLGWGIESASSAHAEMEPVEPFEEFIDRRGITPQNLRR